jgi:hypothetical protein
MGKMNGDVYLGVVAIVNILDGDYLSGRGTSAIIQINKLEKAARPIEDILKIVNSFKLLPEASTSRPRRRISRASTLKQPRSNRNRCRSLYH